MSVESDGPVHPTTLIIGARSQIAQALMAQVLAQAPAQTVIAVSRAEAPDTDVAHSGRLHWLSCDYSPEAIAATCAQVRTLAAGVPRIILCNGVLHGSGFRPEKRFEDLSADTLLHVYRINAVLPLLWIQGLLPMLQAGPPCVMAVFSARVASIADNGRGGWYSYRAAKAALNMLLKTAAIELARRAPQVKLMAFHPGTVDTPLSKPFQASVPPGKLFTPAFVADRLLGLMDRAQADGTLDFLDWDGQPIPW